MTRPVPRPAKTLVPALVACCLLAGCSTGTQGAGAESGTSANDSRIVLADGASIVEGTGAVADGDAVTVSAGGTYVLSGALADGSVTVNAPGEDVTLVLGGVDLASSAAAAVQVDAALSVTVELADGTENAIRHTGTADGEDGSCIRSAASLTVRGGGSLQAKSDQGDCLYSDGDITLEAGTCTFAAGDDGAHAEGALTVTGGSHTVTECTEGLEGAQVRVEGGSVDVRSSDDSFNASGDDDALAIDISGGSVRVVAGGDGLDSNGSLAISGGDVSVASTGDADGALDFETDCAVTGGTLVAAGGNMPAVPTSCGQPVVAVGFGAELVAGSEVRLTAEDGNTLTFTLPAASRYAVLSSPDLVEGAAYTVSWDGGSADVTVSADAVTQAGEGLGGPGSGPGEKPSGNGAPGSGGEPALGGEPPTKPEGESEGGKPPAGAPGDAPEAPDGNGAAPQR